MTIYVSRNERRVLKADCIKSLPIGAHWITRRPKPKVVGKEDAVCPGRGKFAVARGRVVSCISQVDWNKTAPSEVEDPEFWLKEARLEQFDSVDGWLNWYKEHKIDIDKLYRIEMVKIHG